MIICANPDKSMYINVIFHNYTCDQFRTKIVVPECQILKANTYVKWIFPQLSVAFLEPTFSHCPEFLIQNQEGKVKSRTRPILRCLKPLSLLSRAININVYIGKLCGVNNTNYDLFLSAYYGFRAVIIW